MRNQSSQLARSATIGIQAAVLLTLGSCQLLEGLAGHGGSDHPETAASSLVPNVATKPTVVSLVPTNAQAQSPTGKVTIFFREEVKPSAAVAAVSVFADGAPVAGNASYDPSGRVLSFVPQHPIPASSQVRVQVGPVDKKAGGKIAPHSQTVSATRE